jgi:hypothetical protein
MADNGLSSRLNGGQIHSLIPANEQFVVIVELSKLPRAQIRKEL